jgi:hypothetical protein
LNRYDQWFALGNKPNKPQTFWVDFTEFDYSIKQASAKELRFCFFCKERSSNAELEVRQYRDPDGRLKVELAETHCPAVMSKRGFEEEVQTKNKDEKAKRQVCFGVDSHLQGEFCCV